MPTEQKAPFWSMTKNAAKNSGELVIYGYITEFDWWDEDITPQKFNQDLANLGDIDELVIRINSGGGSVTAGVAIHSMIKRHKAKTTVYIDGWAASIASIIAMAGDKIIMGKGSMLMIHNPSSGAWGEAKDLRKQADVLDQVRESLIDIYEARSSKNRDEIGELLDKETFLSAAEAVEYGFADEIEESLPVVASMRNGTAFFNGFGFDFSKFKNPPKLPTLEVQNQAVSVSEEPKNERNGDKLTLEELKNKYPDLYNQIFDLGVQNGVTAERVRMKAIDEIGMPGSENVINKAKYETGISAEATALEIVKAQKAKGAQYLTNLQNDAKLSGLENIDPAAPDVTQSKDEKVAEAGSMLANIINKMRGGE